MIGSWSAEILGREKERSIRRKETINSKLSFYSTVACPTKKKKKEKRANNLPLTPYIQRLSISGQQRIVQ